MPKINSLVPIGLARKIINSIPDEDIISYDGAVGSQNNPSEPDKEISVVEVKIVFETVKKKNDEVNAD
jgi:hypothetical protein